MPKPEWPNEGLNKDRAWGLKTKPDEEEANIWGQQQVYASVAFASKDPDNPDAWLYPTVPDLAIELLGDSLNGLSEKERKRRIELKSNNLRQSVRTFIKNMDRLNVNPGSRLNKAQRSLSERTTYTIEEIRAISANPALSYDEIKKMLSRVTTPRVVGPQPPQGVLIDQSPLSPDYVSPVDYSQPPTLPPIDQRDVKIDRDEFMRNLLAGKRGATLYEDPTKRDK